MKVTHAQKRSSALVKLASFFNFAVEWNHCFILPCIIAIRGYISQKTNLLLEAVLVLYICRFICNILPAGGRF